MYFHVPLATSDQPVSVEVMVDGRELLLHLVISHKVCSTGTKDNELTGMIIC